MRNLFLLAVWVLSGITVYAQQNARNTFVLNPRATAFQSSDGWRVIIDGNQIPGVFADCPKTDDNITYVVMNKQGLFGLIDEKGKVILEYRYSKINNSSASVFFVTEPNGTQYPLDRATLQKVEGTKVNQEDINRMFGVSDEVRKQLAEENRARIEAEKKAKEEAEALRWEEVDYDEKVVDGKKIVYFKGKEVMRHKNVLLLYSQSPFDRYWFFACYDKVGGDTVLGIKVYNTETGGIESLLPIEYDSVSSGTDVPDIFTFRKPGRTSTYRINGATEKVFQLLKDFKDGKEVYL